MTASCLLVIRKDAFLVQRTTPKTIEAILIRYQTKDKASIEINLPKMAVKPKIKTIK
jgi:hypothetical protein